MYKWIIIKYTSIKPHEPVARYILSKSHFSSQKNIVKVGAFYPPPKNYPNEISVFRVIYLSDKEIWSLGDKEVASKRGRNILARADFIVSDIVESKLKIEKYTKKLHYRHANIILPDDEIESKESAAELALKAKLVIR